jgi:primary-amine oxidase
MANSLTLGCDCKGSIHYLDAEFPARNGDARTIKNAGECYLELPCGQDVSIGLVQQLQNLEIRLQGQLLTLDIAVCIHEEDAGILFKHNDFRDESVIVTRARKLIIQQIFTAANYEYAVQVSRYWHVTSLIGC